jgi:hypothetical protein
MLGLTLTHSAPTVESKPHPNLQIGRPMPLACRC